MLAAPSNQLIALTTALEAAVRSSTRVFGPGDPGGVSPLLTPFSAGSGRTSRWSDRR